MSYENVPCASPDETDGQEEPAPSLYGVDTHEDKIRSVKQPLSLPSRLAETANIEDHVIMGEEEIANVGDSVSLIQRRDLYSQNRSSSKERKDDAKRLEERKSSTPFQRERWIDLNLPNVKKSHSFGGNNAEVPTNEFTERGTASVIKRTVQDVSPDSENRNVRTVTKDEYLKLHCSEKLDSTGTSNNVDRVRAYYYHNSHEDQKGLPSGVVRETKDDYDSDNEKRLKIQDHRNLPQVFYMQHPSSVALSQAGKLPSPAMGVLPSHSHLIHNRFADSRVLHGQRAEYAANRPEQQVPVANSSAESGDHTRYPGISTHSGIQYVDRQGYVQQGFAVLPGIGPVRVVDGMYYSAIPMGRESNHYENFGPVPTFVPNIQGDSAVLHQRQSKIPPTGSSSADQQSSQNQDKIQNNKPFVSPSSPPPEDIKQCVSQPVKNDSDSPAPAAFEDQEKKIPVPKPKGRPKPVPGSKPEIKCEQCGKIFGSSSALAKHKLTHSDERRYVCNICSKGFKRQDHLNGHMVTHRDKKPYECHFQDCDKSYCDMRSLRRHLENHHSSGTSEGSSRTASPALTSIETTANSCTPPSEAPRVVIKPGRGRPPKDRNLKLDVHQQELLDSESGKSSGTSTPCSNHEVVIVHDQASKAVPRERSSDSISSTGSEDVSEGKHASTPEDGKSHTAIDLLKQAAERAQEQRDKQNKERFPQQQYVMYADGSIPYQQWYQASMFAGQDPRFNAVYQYPQLFPGQPIYHHAPQMILNNPNLRHGMPTRIYSDNETHVEQQGKQQTTPIQTVQRSPSVEFVPASSQVQFSRQPGQQSAGTPTDPMAIALATAKDRGQQLFTRESYYSNHPSGTQWQQVRYDDSTNQYNKSETSSMGNAKTSFNHVQSPSNSSTSSEVDGENTEHYQRGMHFAAGYDRKPSETNYSKKDHSFHHVPEGTSPTEEQKTDNKDNGIFRNPAEIVTPRQKQRRRPEPLKIPASVSTYQTSHGVPGSPPYTPPPMLSPRSLYSHVNPAGNLTPRSGLPQLPMTPSRLLLSSRSRTSIDGEEESVVFPEPKINIGPQFQAKIPDRILPKELAKNDIHKATLVWNLMDEKKKGRTQEIQAFLEMSASCAVLGGSSNKEYALHILQRTKGNIKEAVRLLLSKKYVPAPSDPMYDYHYEGSVKWSARERQTFRNAFRIKNKDFNDLQKEIGTKSVADCVEFYYLWKANNPEAVRGRTRYVDSSSEEEYEDDTGSDTNSNPSLFECDFPQCSAKFVSRQALNGHIRVHGGSFMKPSETRKRRNPTTTTNQDGETVVVKRPRKPYVPQPMPQPLVEGGPLPEYACKVCGRIFHKIKSRSAHMKTHVKRPDDDHKHDMQH